MTSESLVKKILIGKSNERYEQRETAANCRRKRKADRREGKLIKDANCEMRPVTEGERGRRGR